MADKLEKLSVRKGNILHNGNFIDVINQRGQSSYTGTWTDNFIDRWIIGGGQLTADVLSDGILCTPGPDTGVIGQTFDFAESEYLGKTFTAAIQIGGKVYTATLTFPSDGSYAHEIIAGTDMLFSFHVNRIGFVFASPVKVERLHLEPGDTFTGFDMKGRGERLAECQRFQLAGAMDNVYRTLGTSALGQSAGPDYIVNIFVPTPTTMRANPSIEVSGQFYLYDGTQHFPVTSIANAVAVADGVFLDVHADNLTAGRVYRMQSLDTPATFILNANL
jgi:hypothetical protein